MKYNEKKKISIENGIENRNQRSENNVSWRKTMKNDAREKAINESW